MPDPKRGSILPAVRAIITITNINNNRNHQNKKDYTNDDKILLLITADTNIHNSNTRYNNNGNDSKRGAGEACLEGVFQS